jgi:transcriptional regulator with XRE-family HTH domain
MSDVYEVIEELRKHKYWSRRKLAHIAGINENTMVTIMSRRSPSISKIRLNQIANVFGVTWQDLVSENAINIKAAKVPATLTNTEKEKIIQNITNKDLYKPVKTESEDIINDAVRVRLEYKNSLIEYYRDGHANMEHLMSEYEGFLDCLMALNLLEETWFIFCIDEFRNELKASRR